MKGVHDRKDQGEQRQQELQHNRVTLCVKGNIWASLAEYRQSAFYIRPTWIPLGATDMKSLLDEEEESGFTQM